MRIPGVGVSRGVLATTVLLMCLIGTKAADRSKPGSPGIGDARALRAGYERWKAQYKATDGDRILVLSLGYSKGLSTEFTTARGQATLQLTDGTVSVSVSGLAADEAFAVWLVDNRDGNGRSVKPEPGDLLLRLGTLGHHDGRATLETRLDLAQLAGFEIDLIVVTRASQTPVDGGLLFGSPSLFDRIYYSERAGRLASFTRGGEASTPTAFDIFSAPFRALIPRPAYAQESELITVLQALVDRGGKLFFE